MNVLVIPTIREKNLIDFLEAWGNPWGNQDWQIVVVEDNPSRSFKLDTSIAHYSWQEIDKEFGDLSWIISRRDSAIRSFGFWVAATQLNADYIFTLDDDCLPLPDVDFIKQHISNLTETTCWTESVFGHRTRGIPYHNLGVLKNVVLSVGLWEGVPDFDAVQCLSQTGSIELPKHNRILPRHQYAPICGMNLCFKNCLAPLMYFCLMGKDWPYGRFDDIWAGIICKKICDHLDWSISVGHPFIYHSKASNVFKNLTKEAPGIELNEWFWEVIDSIKLTKNTPLECMDEIGRQLIYYDNVDYLKKLGAAIMCWTTFFPSPSDSSSLNLEPQPPHS